MEAAKIELLSVDFANCAPSLDWEPLALKVNCGVWLPSKNHPTYLLELIIRDELLEKPNILRLETTKDELLSLVDNLINSFTKLKEDLCKTLG